MHDRLTELVTTGRLRTLRPRAVLVLLVWEVDHPRRDRPRAQRVEELTGMSRWSVRRGMRELESAQIVGQGCTTRRAA